MTSEACAESIHIYIRTGVEEIRKVIASVRVRVGVTASSQSSVQVTLGEDSGCVRAAVTQSNITEQNEHEAV